MADALALAIETSNPSAGRGAAVAVGRSGPENPEILGVEDVRTPERHSDDLLPAIERLARRVGFQAPDLDLVCVSVGPGGYTGLRVAIVAAQAIADAAGARCVGVPTELVVARRARTGDRPFAVCLASKGTTTYARPFDAAGHPSGTGRVIGADGLERLGAEVLVADRFLPAPMRERADALGLAIAQPTFDARAVLEAAGSLEPTDPSRLRAIYPREPDAVTQWRRLHGGDAEAPAGPAE